MDNKVLAEMIREKYYEEKCQQNTNCNLTKL